MHISAVDVAGSSRSRRDMEFLRSMTGASSRMQADSSVTDTTAQMLIVNLASIPAEFLRAPSPPSCLCCSRPDLSWLSTSMRRRHLASKFAEVACHRRRGNRVKRREFITLLGGAVAWPLAARAQQPERVRRVGVLVGLAENDPEMKERIAGLRQGLEKLGWAEGSN